MSNEAGTVFLSDDEVSSSITQASSAHSHVAPGAGGDLEHDAANQPPMTSEDHQKAFWRDVKKLGEQSGAGSSALPRLYLAAARAADDGLINAEKPSGPGAKDDATRIYEAYMEADSKKAEHTAGGAKANASKLRQVIQAASMTTADFINVCQDVIVTREKLSEAEVKVKALAPAIVDAARAQLGQDTQLTSEQIEDCIRVVPKAKTLEDELRAISKRVDDLITGEGKHGLKDQSETTIKVGELLRERLQTFGMSRGDESFIKLAMERGYTREQAESLIER